MGKKLRFLMVAAAIALFSTNAMAQDEEVQEQQEVQEQEATATEAKTVSSNGSYEFKRSWGIGLQYGLTFTEMSNWNDYLLIPARMNYFDVNFVASHELYVEFTAVEGFRMAFFGGYQSLYITDTGFNYAYGGIEPAFSIRRSFYEFAVGLGVAYGYSWLDSKDSDMNGHGLYLRPFVEARFYMGDIFALYLRVAFAYFQDFGLEPTKYAKARDLENKIDTDKLRYTGPHVAVGFRFGDYETPVTYVEDTDGDGVYDDVDACPTVKGTEEFKGCPNPDPDGDAVCDAWVSDENLSDVFGDQCKGLDKCPDVAGTLENDGCPNPDTDKDGVCDPWVSEKNLLGKYADICRGSDQCVDDSEDRDNFQDDDGCPDPDNDGDAICDPWVMEKGVSSKYASICTARDVCPDLKGLPEFSGCPNPDTDGDGYCDAWVYDNNFQSFFPQCKGVDKCPNEKGADPDGCVMAVVLLTKDKIQINEKIYFDLGKSTIKSVSDGLIEEIAKVLKENPQIKKIEIQGHTDTSGSAKTNTKLSNARAKAVQDRLVKLGVEKKRLSHKGYGSSQLLIPLEPGQKKETDEQAAANRRVEFVILQQDTQTK